MLDSLFSQSYPMEKIFLVVVDGGSTDGTVDLIRNKVENSNLFGYQIITEKSSIPEARNSCIDMLKGELLLFWDSDVIINKKGIEQLVKVIIDGKADIATAIGSSIFLNSLDEIKPAIEKFRNEMDNITVEGIEQIPGTGMGHTAISIKVIESGIRFDPDLTWGEDYDFGFKALKKRFNIVDVKKAYGLDINIMKMHYSDIYLDMPLRLFFKALPRKARDRIIEPIAEINLTYIFSHYRKYKRFIFYLAYPVIMVISLYGFLTNNLFYLMCFPISLSFYLIWQVNRRGLNRGLKMTFRSIIAGIPYAYLQLYYLLKYLIMDTR